MIIKDIRREGVAVFVDYDLFVAGRGAGMETIRGMPMLSLGKKFSPVGLAMLTLS